MKITALLALVYTLSANAVAAPLASLGSRTEDAAVVQRCIKMWETGDLREFDTLVAADYVGHVASGTRDREGLKARIKAFRTTFPDIRFTIEDQFGSGEKVVTRMQAEATNSVTGVRTSLIGINISRVRGGKVVEEWATWEAKTP